MTAQYIAEAANIIRLFVARGREPTRDNTTPEQWEALYQAASALVRRLEHGPLSKTKLLTTNG